MTAILFDLDGTLVDTAPDLIAATAQALARHGYPPVAAEVIRPAVGNGAEAMIAAALAEAGTVPTAVERAAMLDDFMAYYSSNLAVASTPFPGLVPALEALQQRGWRLAVATNKLEANALAVLDALDLRRFFGEAVVAGDTLPRAKPFADPLIEAARRAGGHIATSVMVGDSITDAAAADAAGIPFVAVTFGYGPHWEGLPVAAVIDHFEELTAALDKAEVAVSPAGS